MEKILHISNYYYPHIGGIERTAQYIAEGMAEYHNEVVCFSEFDDNPVDFINHIKIHRMKIEGKLMGQALSWEYYKRLKKILLTFEPDAILLHTPNPFVYPIILSLLDKETKLVVLWHSDIVKQKFAHHFIKFAENKLMRRADLILATSPLYRDSSPQLSKHINKVKILPSAINPQDFTKTEKIQTLIDEIKNKYPLPIVFFIGRHVSYKGVELLIKAERFIKNDCHIIIAGDGPLSDRLKHENESQRITFIGKLSHEEKVAYMHASDIFAFPSITKNEAFGLALVEAMFCESVPVTFKIIGSGANWVCPQNVTGLEVANSDISGYAKAIDSLLTDEKQRELLAINAHQRVLDLFSSDKEVETVNRYFHEI